jgi:hypothetical protein
MVKGDNAIFGALDCVAHAEKQNKRQEQGNRVKP